jgi:hypothetical protein
MPDEVWDGWRWPTHREHADQAMVNSIRRGNVSCRLGAYLRAGAYEQGSSIFGWWLNPKIPLQTVIAGLLKLHFGSPLLREPIRAEYETTDEGSSIRYGGPPVIPGWPARPVTTRRIAVLNGAELAFDQFREDLILYELPAGAQPTLTPPDRPREKQRLGYMRHLKQFLGGLPEDTGLSDDDIAGLFITHIGTLDEADRPHLPAQRYIEVQIGKLPPKIWARRTTPNNA